MAGCTDPDFTSPNCGHLCNISTKWEAVLCADKVLSEPQLYSCRGPDDVVGTVDNKELCSRNNFTYGPLRPWDGVLINSTTVATAEPDTSSNSPFTSWSSTITAHSPSKPTEPEIKATGGSGSVSLSSTQSETTPQTSSLPPIPTNPSKPSSIAIGAGVGVPATVIALSFLVIFFARKQQRRKQAEKKAKELAKRVEHERWSKPILDSTTIHELNGRGIVQELDSKPIGAVEIGSNQIYEARASGTRTTDISD